jgi:hypothetical protein
MGGAALPKVSIVFYQEDADTVPVLDWLDTLPLKALDKCRVKVERLQELGHELRRPEADYLRDGMYELRVGLQGRNYRILYFFHGQTGCGPRAWRAQRAGRTGGRYSQGDHEKDEV